jgi:hypothetical protein
MPSHKGVYLIDFGLAKQLFNKENGQHIPLKQGVGIVGSLCFTSIASHLKNE